MSRTINATNYAYTVEGDLKNFSESRWNAFKEKEVKEGRPEPVPVRVGTFIQYEAETPADFNELVSNDDVNVALWNRGASLKQLNEIRAIMEDADVPLTDEPIDLKEALGRETERRTADPEEKARKALAALDPAQFQKIMDQMLAARGLSVGSRT